MFYFFLSYARGDDDSFVQQFHHELSAEVRSHAGLSLDRTVGFFDAHSLEMGATWSARLMRALGESSSFVALCSPRYFLSEPCGKEWAVFADRLREYERDSGLLASAILPLLWLPPREIPRPVSELQYDNHDLPPAYRRTGLRQLMRLQRHHDSYLEFVSQLARQIVDNAETHLPVSARDGDFDAVASVFHPGRPTRPGQPGHGNVDPLFDHGTETPNGTVPALPPAHHVRFVVAAPTRAEIEQSEVRQKRRDLRYYGERSRDWKPYLPALPTPLAEYARGVAERRAFSSGVTDLSEVADLDNRVGQDDQSDGDHHGGDHHGGDHHGGDHHGGDHQGGDQDSDDEDNQIVVLLVDAWATQLTEYRRALAEWNNQDRRWDESVTPVLIPRNPDDEETQVNWMNLLDSVRAIFVLRDLNGDVLFRPGILTYHAFDADLQVVLEVARNRIFAKGRVFRRPPGPTTALPTFPAP